MRRNRRLFAIANLSRITRLQAVRPFTTSSYKRGVYGAAHAQPKQGPAPG